MDFDHVLALVGLVILQIGGAAATLTAPPHVKFGVTMASLGVYFIGLASLK